MIPREDAYASLQLYLQNSHLFEEAKALVLLNSTVNSTVAFSIATQHTNRYYLWHES